MPPDMPHEWYFNAAMSWPVGSPERWAYEWTGRAVRWAEEAGDVE